MEIIHVNHMRVVQFETDNGKYRRFGSLEWYKEDGTSWVYVVDTSELEKEYQEIRKEEPSILGLEERGKEW